MERLGIAYPLYNPMMRMNFDSDVQRCRRVIHRINSDVNSGVREQIRTVFSTYGCRMKAIFSQVGTTYRFRNLGQ